jgi:6-pyruvoyltetrahydropterin/6-carboxytetrahydropterin synthase
MYRLCVQSEFSAAHYLNDYQGPCKRVHGHNWKVKVLVSARDVDDHGMVMDLIELKKLLEKCLNRFDHRILNEVSPLDGMNPTSENIARVIYNWLAEGLPNQVTLDSVQVFETDDFSVIYSND